MTNHDAYGIGVYSFFRDYDVTVVSGIKAPEVSGVNFTDSISVFLNGNGGIQHVINNDGDAVYNGHGQSWDCSNSASSLFLQ